MVWVWVNEPSMASPGNPRASTGLAPLLGAGSQLGTLGRPPASHGGGLPGLAPGSIAPGFLGTPPKPFDLLHAGLPFEELRKQRAGAVAAEQPLPPASSVVQIAASQMSPAVELVAEPFGSRFLTPPRQREAVPVPVPVQPLLHTNGAAHASNGDPARSPSKAAAQIGAALADAEHQLSQNPDLTAAESPAPALSWLDSKIRSMRERGIRRTEQQMYLEELRRLVAGSALPTQPSETLLMEDVGALDERWKRVASKIQGQQMEWAYEHEELYRALSHLRRQQKVSEDEREELRRLQETECEGYLKDVEHAAEALEESSRLARQAEESEAQAKLKTQALEGQLQEALAEKQRVYAGAASTQAELVSAKEISQKVLDNCRVLQNRNQDLESERAADRDRQQTLERESLALIERNRELEARILVLEDENARLRSGALAPGSAAPVAAAASAPALCAPMVVWGAEASPRQAKEAWRKADEELAGAEWALESINASSSVAPVLTGVPVPTGVPTALGPRAVPSTSGKEPKEPDTIHSRVKELEREMVAAHQKTLCLDGIQPASRTRTPPSSRRNVQSRRSSAPSFSVVPGHEAAESAPSASRSKPRHSIQGAHDHSGSKSSLAGRVPLLSLPMGQLADAPESAAPTFAPLDSCDEASTNERCHNFGGNQEKSCNEADPMERKVGLMRQLLKELKGTEMEELEMSFEELVQRAGTDPTGAMWPAGSNASAISSHGPPALADASRLT